MKDIGSQDREFELFSRKAASWKGSLSEIGEDIYSIMSEAEGGYLSVGEKLNEFQSMSGEITEMSSHAASLISGEEFTGLIHKLKSVLERLKAYHEQISMGTINYKDRLSELLDHVKAVSSQVSDLRGIAKNLQFLSLATKIQSAVTGSAASGFHVLALNVKSLTLNVIEKTDAIERSVKNLMEKVSMTLFAAIKLENSERKETERVLDGAMELIRSLEKKREAATLFSEDLLFRSKDISSRIDKVVMSMQFHDITRQKTEHVKEAIDILVNRQWVADDDSATDEDKSEVGLPEAIHVCALQSSQLKSARKELVTATEDILKNLAHISRSTSGLIVETGNIIKGAGGEKDSFIDRMDDGLSSLTATVEMLTANVAAAHELSSAVDMFSSVVAEMSSFTMDMEQIENEIEVLALNAGIRAGQIGEKGAGLGKIAMNIQILSGKTHVPTVEIARSMRSITSIADEMSALLMSEEKARDEVLTAALSELNDLLAIFRDLNGKILADLRSFENCGQHLTWEIDRTVESVNVHKVTADVLDRAANGIENTINRIMQEIPRHKVKNVSDILNDLSNLYTMQSERDVHRAYALTGGRPGDDGENRTVRSTEDDYRDDDNIELFTQES